MKSLIYTDNPLLVSALNRYNQYRRFKKKDSFYSPFTISIINKPVNIIDFLDNGIDNNVFGENFISLYPAFHISDKKEIVGPLTILNTDGNKLKDELDYLFEILSIYEVFIKKFNESLRFGNIFWNQIDNLNNDKKAKIILLNIQNGNLGYWNQLTQKIISNLQENTYFIFYWIGEFKKTLPDSLYKKDLEYNDLIWGYSRFLRDFLEARNIGFELEIPFLIKSDNNSASKFVLDIKKLSVDLAIIRNKITRPARKEIQNNSVDYFSLFTQSLKGIYGDNFPAEKILTKDGFWAEINRYFLFNKNRFANNLEDLQDNLLDITSKGNVSTHGILREKDGWIGSYKRDDYYSGLGNIEFWFFLRKNVSALLNSIVNYKTYEKDEEPTFLIIDDNYKPIEDKIPLLNLWFPESKFYYTTSFDWKDFLNPQIDNCLLHNLGAIKTYDKGKFIKVDKNNVCSLKPDFIVVDLEYNGLLVGYEIIRKLKNAIISSEMNMHIIVFSRYEDPYVIRKSINSGALLYVTKANYLRIINKIFLLKFTFKDKRSPKKKTYTHYENWHKLNKLDPSKILELRSTIVKGEEYDSKKGEWPEEKFNSTEHYHWIQKLPKADLHCHIGSCIGPDLLPMTASVVLANKYKFDEKKDKFKLGLIIEYLVPFIADPNLNENSDEKTQPAIVEKYKKSIISICKLDKSKVDLKKMSIFEIVTLFLKNKNYQKAPEEVLLSPQDTSLDRLWYKNTQRLPSLLKAKLNLRESEIKYAEVMLCFILLLYYRDTEDTKFSILKERIKNKIKKNKNLPRINDRLIKDQFINFLDSFYSIIATQSVNIVFKDQNILEFLQSAHSNRRCLAANEGSLFNYLRGCEYGGAEHLQTRMSIYLVTDYIVNEYARKSNIRYLDLRCAVDGYSSMGMQTQEEAIEALLRGFDYFTHQKGEKIIHVNLIVTAKRHKSEKEFENNVRLALKYRHGLALNSQDYKSDYKSYFDSLTRVVSFDLAGLEKGNRPSKFYQQFLPLLRDCFPITVHAGEEDDYESVWEAIYLIQAQRIGHALTLRNKKELLEFVRERHITIELCPMSNYLTKNKYNEKYVFRSENELSKEDIISNLQTYPLRQYLQENLDVTINTDNPFVNNANIVQEYLFAANLIGGLSKWEILRLIKNSFRGTAISKKDKRKLMNEIENEIFEILADEL